MTPQEFLDGIGHVRQGFTASIRSYHILDALNAHSVEAMPDWPAGWYEDLLQKISDGEVDQVSGDELRANIGANPDSYGPVPYQLLMVATTYAIEAIRSEEADPRAAWDRAFDAAQWEGFLSGMLASGTPDGVHKAMKAMLAGAARGGQRSAETRKQDAIDPKVVERAARRLGWPEVTKDIYKKVAKGLPVSSTRVGQILREILSGK